jgi:hypothetical protein
VAKRFRRPTRAWQALHPEIRQQRLAAAKVIEQDHAPTGAHELRKLVNVERALWVQEQKAVFGLQLREINLCGRNDAAAAELPTSEAHELGAALPIGPREIKRRGPPWKRDEKKHEEELETNQKVSAPPGESSSQPWQIT